METLTPSLETSISLESSAEPKSAETSAAQPENEFAHAIDGLRNIGADFILYAGEIEFGHEQDMKRLLESMTTRADEVILWLTTPGGNPDAAYSMARQLQRSYKKFTMFINGWCKSSGTLMALGAHTLIMDDLGQLGPLDIQILNREEFGERHSGLNPIEALRAINFQAVEVLKQQFLDIRFGGGLSTRQALEVATNLTGQLMSPITSQLDIMKYGEFTRSMRIANEYGSRLARNSKDGNVKADTINYLTTGYPSHGFVIDREEASELFTRVEQPSAALQAIAQSLQPIVDKHAGRANNRALLIDLRSALGVPLQAKQEEIEPKPNELAAVQSVSEEAVSSAMLIDTAESQEDEAPYVD